MESIYQMSKEDNIFFAKRKLVDTIYKSANLEGRAITLFCSMQRSQMFMDGNKRVANLVANKEMIRNGLGILVIPVEK